MPRLQLAVLCEAVITDRWSNKVSYINLVDRLTAAALPALVRPLAIGTVWAREHDGAEELKVRVRFRRPGRRPEVVFEGEPVQVDNPKHWWDLELRGLTVKDAGPHCLLLDLWQGSRWRKVAELPVDVAVTEREAAEP